MSDLIFNGSRLEGCKLFYDSDHEMNYIAYLDTDVPVNDSDLVYKFKKGDRLDLLASKFYNDPQKGWLILQANPEYHHEFEIQVGDNIIIPKNDKEVDYTNVNAIG